MKTVVGESITPIVEISDGKIFGLKSLTLAKKEYYRFHGVPYAVPPTGNLRFEDPQPASKWTDLKDCSKERAVCVQFGEQSSERESEDCLTLNIYTPKLPERDIDSDLAVLVFIHGGGYFAGSTRFEYFGPEHFMDHGIIVVLMNYRLGPLGFLSTSDTIIKGNFGLKDQELSLKWIRNNIKKFGGDPNKVIICGNSSGSASIAFHLMNMKNKGLFRGAIMSSGSPLSGWSITRNPKTVAFNLANMTNITHELKNSRELLDYLKTVPIKVLQDAVSKQFQLFQSSAADYLVGENGYLFAPSSNQFDESGFYEHSLYESLAIGNFSLVPIMMGITSEEALMDPKELENNFKNDLVRYDLDHDSMVSSLVYDQKDAHTVGNLLYNLYNDKNETMEKNRENAVRYWSDHCISFAVIKFAELTSKFINVFMYQFSYDGELGGIPYHVKGADSVAHSEDMLYIWRRFYNTSREFNELPKNDKLTHERMLKFYANFVKHLDPTPANDPLLQNIKWKPVNSSSNELEYIDINTELSKKVNPKYDTYAMWNNEIFLKYAPRPWNTV